MLTAKEARLLLNVEEMNRIKKESEDRMKKAIKDSIQEIETIIKQHTETGSCTALYRVYADISQDIIGLLKDSGYNVITHEGINQFERIIEVCW